MQAFANLASTYHHSEWCTNGICKTLAHPPYTFYHYTILNPDSFVNQAVCPSGSLSVSHWCSVQTDDRNCVSLATGIGVYPANIAMWRIELALKSLADVTTFGFLAGQYRWPVGSPYPGAVEFVTHSLVPISGCMVVQI